MGQFFMLAVSGTTISKSATALHFRLLRNACRDYYHEITSEGLTKRCQRANPDEWAFYCSANIVIRLLCDKYPSRLTSLLQSSYFEEPRKTGLGKFFDKSKTRAGSQSIQYDLSASPGTILICPTIQSEFCLKRLIFHIKSNSYFKQFFIFHFIIKILNHSIFI